MRIPILQNHDDAPAGKRHPLNMRTTKELRDKIERAARLSGRSLVQEVEYRLERSFWEDEVRGGLPLPIDSK